MPQDKVPKLKMVSTFVITSLALIAIIALVAKGPPQIYLYTGPTPLNSGSLGTSQLLIVLRHFYNFVTPVISLEDLYKYAKGRKCLYIIVSPQIPITLREARSIVNALSKCDEPALLIADESTFSNALLKVLNAKVRVDGSMILNVTTKLPYPVAIFRINGKYFRVQLDIASSISNCVNKLGIITLGFVMKRNGMVKELRDICVLDYERVGKFSIMVLSDGSILLNQVLKSDKGDKYLGLILSMISKLCGNTTNCKIFIDAIHYKKSSPLAIFSNPAQAKYLDPAAFIPALIAVLVHPATWLPIVLRLANTYINQALTSPYSFTPTIIVSVLILISYLVAKRFIGSGKDYRLPIQEELGAIFSTELHDAISRGKYSFTKEDFIRLYSMVNEAMQSILGTSLADPQCPKVLAHYVGTERALQFYRKMNSYLKKARGERFFPIVISWNRLVKKYLKEAEEILNSLGSSLAERRGAAP